MARGDESGDDGGSGWPWWIAFGAVAFCVLAGVAYAMWPEGERPERTVSQELRGPPPGTHDFERVARPGCDDASAPREGPSRESAIERLLVDRGYAPATPWTDAVSPGEVASGPLSGGCGLLAIRSADPSGAFTGVRRPDGTDATLCTTGLLFVETCDGEDLALMGAGRVRHRFFALPGLAASAREATDLPVAAFVAHAEAERLLVSRGIAPVPQVVIVDVTRSGDVPMPKAPSTGCVGWAVAGEGVGELRVFGATSSSNDGALERGLVGLVTCAPGGPSSDSLAVLDADGRGGRLFVRPYRLATAPTLGTEAPVPLAIGDVRVVATSDLDLADRPAGRP